MLLPQMPGVLRHKVAAAGTRSLNGRADTCRPEARRRRCSGRSRKSEPDCRYWRGTECFADRLLALSWSGKNKKIGVVVPTSVELDDGGRCAKHFATAAFAAGRHSPLGRHHAEGLAASKGRRETNARSTTPRP